MGTSHVSCQSRQLSHLSVPWHPISPTVHSDGTDRWDRQMGQLPALAGHIHGMFPCRPIGSTVHLPWDSWACPNRTHSCSHVIPSAPQTGQTDGTAACSPIGTLRQALCSPIECWYTQTGSGHSHWYTQTGSGHSHVVIGTLRQPLDVVLLLHSDRLQTFPCSPICTLRQAMDIPI